MLHNTNKQESKHKSQHACRWMPYEHYRLDQPQNNMQRDPDMRSGSSVGGNTSNAGGTLLLWIWNSRNTDKVIMCLQEGSSSGRVSPSQHSLSDSPSQCWVNWSHSGCWKCYHFQHFHLNDGMIQEKISWTNRREIVMMWDLKLIQILLS